MAVNFVNIDRDTPMLLPHDLKLWIPENHLVHFILDALETLDLTGFKVNTRGTGSKQYPPRMMLALLIYSYATGRFHSRKIEEATYSDIAIRYICGGDYHPDHDTICTFRRVNEKIFEECFVKVLALAQELGKLKKIGTISIDGTKVKANASKHSAVSYKRAGEMIIALQEEVQALVAKAEEADNTPLDDGLSIPDEIARREDRIQALKNARKVIEEQFDEKKKNFRKTMRKKSKNGKRR